MSWHRYGRTTLVAMETAPIVDVLTRIEKQLDTIRRRVTGTEPCIPVEEVRYWIGEVLEDLDNINQDVLTGIPHEHIHRRLALLSERIHQHSEHLSTA